MAIHFLHIRKSGGTAIRFALDQAQDRSGGPLMTPFGELIHHPHTFRLEDVPKGDFAVFSVRDPAARFVSGFYSRLRKGAPRYEREWSRVERLSFGWFSTPQQLAEALSEGGWRRRKAKLALKWIRHIRKPMVWWTGDATRLREKLPQVAYIARQETLDDDFERLKRLLELPTDLTLPTDPVSAHRFVGDDDRQLTPKMLDALRDWYAEDYAMLEVSDQARAEMIDRSEPPAPSPQVTLN